MRRRWLATTHERGVSGEAGECQSESGRRSDIGRRARSRSEGQLGWTGSRTYGVSR